MFSVTWCLCIAFATSSASAQLSTATARASDLTATAFLNMYCAGCHTGAEVEGDFRFSEEGLIDWDAEETTSMWEQVQTMVSRRMMPYPDDDQPTEPERQQFLKWLDQKLVQKGRLGGTVLRRLSRREYGNTIQSVFGFRKFAVSDDFPPDSTFQGFDNHGRSMVTAPGHLEALVNNAITVADRIFPQSQTAVKPEQTRLTPDDLVISYSSALQVDGAVRLASSGSNYRRNATWPTRFEAPVKGIYQVRVLAEAIQPPEGHVPEIRLGTMQDNRSVKGEVGLKSIAGSGVQELEFEVTLDIGQTVSFLYSNGPFRYDDKQDLEAFLTDFFARHPDIAAAWDKVGEPARGGSGWKQVQKELAKGNLPVRDYAPNSAKFDKLVKRLRAKNVNTGETLVYRFFEQGPAVAIHEVIIEGPIRILPTQEQIEQQEDRERFLNRWALAVNSEAIEARMEFLLAQIFRRPATNDEVQRYAEVVRHEANRSGVVDEGWHLALRSALISPSFLYRSIGDETEESAHHLACRLSYFLTSGPPDEELRRLAASDELLKPDVLRKQARRLISDTFVEDFCRQWLHLSVLDSLMPDARLMPDFTDQHRQSMSLEVTKTFGHVLRKNLPVIDLIAPDFVFCNTLLGLDIYELPEFQKQAKRKKVGYWSKVPVDPGGHHGGLLCMAAVTTATANGVDTQPVLRGVWMLENILGTPPPEPPDSVPALTPDTSAATTVKERLAAHMSDSNCATCHREIDPVGFVLENFDPVGRWRSHYPIYKTSGRGKKQKVTTEDGQRVDSTGILPDGTKLKDVTDLKAWLVNHPDQFARCLSEKLMTYATGRELSYRERTLIHDVVRSQRKTSPEGILRLEDLLLALVASDVFLSP